MNRAVHGTLGALSFALLAAGPCFAASIAVDVPLRHSVLSGCVGGTGQLNLGPSQSERSLSFKIQARQAFSTAREVETRVSAKVVVLR